MTTRSCLGVLVERAAIGISGLLLWILGIRIGIYGGEGFYQYVLPKSSIQVHILYGVTELLVGIMFFIALRRQLIPGGMKELNSEPMTLVNKAKYLPSIFVLGMVAGLACDILVVFIIAVLPL